MLLGLSAYDSSGSDEEQEVKVVKQKKKITIPQAKYHSSDDDDDSYGPAAKKLNLSAEPKKASGLFSKLPPPRNTIGGGKQTQRPLIPHVFSKKPAAPSTSVATKKKLKAADNDSDSSDNEDVEFFSFVDKQSKVQESEKETNDAASSSVKVAPINILPDVALAAPSVSQPSIPFETSIPSADTTNHTADSFGVPNQSFAAHPQVAVGPAMDLPESVSAWHTDDRFKRIQGKKNRNENIDVIDVNADSALEGSKELLLQQISEEKNMNRMSHSKKNSNAPSATSKRKHQLSYLIHQAKEREIELKNAWASGNAARKAARNRYGF